MCSLQGEAQNTRFPPLMVVHVPQFHLCRYLDLFTTYYSIYNSVMKVLYIGSTAYIVHMIRFQVVRMTAHPALLSPSTLGALNMPCHDFVGAFQGSLRQQPRLVLAHQVWRRALLMLGSYHHACSVQLRHR